MHTITRDKIDILHTQVIELHKSMELQLKILEKFKGRVNSKTIAVRRDLNVLSQFMYYYQHILYSKDSIIDSVYFIECYNTTKSIINKEIMGFI